MSVYTTELRYICETGGKLNSDFINNDKESKGYNNIDDIIEGARPNIFSFNYPIFDETYKPLLETKILRHYYTREICEETVGLWKLRLQDKMNLIMPYYNKLYESELLTFNPFYDVNLTRKHKGEKEADETRTVKGKNTHEDNTMRSVTGESGSDRKNTITSDGSTETTNEQREEGRTDVTDKKWDLYSDTPQGGIRGIEGEGISDTIADNTYLTNARKNTDDGRTQTHNSSASNEKTDVNTSSSTNDKIDNKMSEQEKSGRNGNNTHSEIGKTNLKNLEDYIEYITGKQGSTSYSKMLEEFRHTFINIDKMVIDELSDLFFNLW